MFQRLMTALLAIMFLAAVPAALDAQDVTIGVKGGLNFANITTDDPDLDSSDTRNGFLAGAFVEIGLGEVFALQPEVLYAQKGFSEQEDGVDLTAEVDYFEIPVLLKARFGAESTVRPGLYAGPVISFESSCSIVGEDAGVSVDVDCDLDDEGFAERTKTDFGIAFGGEVQFDVSDNVVALVDARYLLGLADIASDIPNFDDTVRTRAFSIMAGLGVKIQ